MIENEKDKPSLEELMHHGVKGMKWGHRKARPSNDDIRGARRRVRAHERKLSDAEDDMTNPNTGKVNPSKAKKFRELESSFLKNPDRATALRLTTGEKFVLAAFGPGGVGVAAGRVVSRKLTEQNIKKHGG